MNVPPTWHLLFTALLLAGVVWALREGRCLELPRASLLLSLATLVLLPGFGLQYLVWPLAVGSLYPSMGLAVYTLAGSIFLVASPSTLHIALPFSVSELGVWAAAALWLAGEAAHARCRQPGSRAPTSLDSRR